MKRYDKAQSNKAKSCSLLLKRRYNEWPEVVSQLADIQGSSRFLAISRESLIVLVTERFEPTIDTVQHNLLAGIAYLLAQKSKKPTVGLLISTDPTVTRHFFSTIVPGPVDHKPQL